MDSKLLRKNLEYIYQLTSQGPALYFSNYKENKKIIQVCWIPYLLMIL